MSLSLAPPKELVIVDVVLHDPTPSQYTQVCPSLPFCDLGPAQLSLYERVSSNQNVACSGEKDRDRLYRSYSKFQKDEWLYYSYSG
jgi:hypothetical protein